MKITADATGAWIREQRERRGMTQGELAAHLKLGQPMISRIEAGRGPIDLERWVAVCDLLGRSPVAALAEVLGRS